MHFHMKQKIVNSITVKNCAGIWMKIVFHLSISLGRMAIFTIILLTIYEHEDLLIFWCLLEFLSLVSYYTTLSCAWLTVLIVLPRVKDHLMKIPIVDMRNLLLILLTRAV